MAKKKKILLLFVFLFLFYLIPSVSLAQTLSPDINQDGVFNIQDLVELINRWGPSGSGNLADRNYDAQVNSIDFSLLSHELTTQPSPASEPIGPELLTNPGFEGNYTRTAPGWIVNNWGNSSYDTSRVSGRTGGFAQEVTSVNTDSGSILFKQKIPLERGHVYQFSAWMKSNTQTDIRLIIRKDESHFNIVATKRLTLGPEWQQIIIQGGFHQNVSVPGAVGFYMLNEGSVQIDDASLVDITDYIRNSEVPSGQIPETLMGMHFNKPGLLNNSDYLPSINYGLVRLWDDVIISQVHS